MSLPGTLDGAQACPGARRLDPAVDNDERQRTVSLCISGHIWGPLKRKLFTAVHYTALSAVAGTSRIELSLPHTRPATTRDNEQQWSTTDARGNLGAADDRQRAL